MQAISPVAGLLGELSPDEAERAARFRSPADRDRYVVGRAGLRRLLSRALGRPPRSLAFDAGPLGKPSLASGSGDADVRFNLSHAGDVVAWVLAEGREVGIDVEAVRPEHVDADRVQAALSPREALTLDAFSDAEAAEAFYTCWTAKEAFGKALGLGLSVGFTRLDVFEALSRRGQVGLRAPGSGALVTVRVLDASPGYRAAWAVEGTSVPARVRDGAQWLKFPWS